MCTGRTAQEADKCPMHSSPAPCEAAIGPRLDFPHPQPPSRSCLEAHAVSVSQSVSVGGFPPLRGWPGVGEGGSCWSGWSQGQREWLCQVVSSKIKSRGWSPISLLLSLHTPVSIFPSEHSEAPGWPSSAAFRPVDGCGLRGHMGPSRLQGDLSSEEGRSQHPRAPEHPLCTRGRGEGFGVGREAEMNQLVI